LGHLIKQIKRIEITIEYDEDYGNRCIEFNTSVGITVDQLEVAANVLQNHIKVLTKSVITK
jgi:hypothetical protein